MKPDTLPTRPLVFLRIALLSLFAFAGPGCAITSAESEVFTPQHIAKIRSVGGGIISPDGAHIAYTLSVPRQPNKDDDGGAWSELHVVDTQGQDRPFITGHVNIGSIAWTPDGRGISFLDKRGDDEHKSLYVIPIDGGEARNVLEHETGVGSYSWSPDGKRVAFLARAKKDKAKKKLEKKGFKAEIYEEQGQPKLVWIGTPDDEDAKPESLDLPGSAVRVKWSPVDNRLAVALAPSPRIDDQYMKSKLHIVDADSGDVRTQFDNPGKLGSFTWSPDGKNLAVISAEDLNDPAEGRLMIAPAAGGALRNILPDFAGHVSAVAWQDHDTVMYVAGVGCRTMLGKIDTDSRNKKMLVSTDGPVLAGLSLTRDGMRSATIGQSARHPREVFTMKHGDAGPTRLTDSNPWLDEMRFADQEIVRYKTRDGMEIEGVLIRPLDEKPGTRYPLILYVHGGPEAHVSDAFITRYSNPGQYAAANGFAVFCPNYRGSTGRGVAFSKLGQADYAGGEFNDLVDAVTHLHKTGLIDKDRVGITGGSYGGFATAWGATNLTEHFAAGVMFVGISDHVSKFGTTDIPNEMYLVHSRTWPWDDWDFFRERSPITYTPQARTPLLILHGKNDTRVHPSQSMELYRYLKTLGKVPVRLVFYPGEGHGNRKAAGRLDYSLRMMRWMEHYLKTPATRTSPPPPHELDYGFDEDENEEDDD